MKTLAKINPATQKNIKSQKTADRFFHAPEADFQEQAFVLFRYLQKSGRGKNRHESGISNPDFPNLYHNISGLFPTPVLCKIL
jgi:hypothetical protein